MASSSSQTKRLSISSGPGGGAVQRGVVADGGGGRRVVPGLRDVDVVGVDAGHGVSGLREGVAHRGLGGLDGLAVGVGHDALLLFIFRATASGVTRFAVWRRPPAGGSRRSPEGMGVDEALRLGADARAVVHLDGAAMVLRQVDDVVVRARVQDVFLPVDFADAVAVLVDAGFLRRDAPEGEARCYSVPSGCSFRAWRAGSLSPLPPCSHQPLLSSHSREAEDRARGGRRARRSRGRRGRR